MDNINYVNTCGFISNDDYYLSINTKLYVSGMDNSKTNFINGIMGVLLQNTHKGNEDVHFIVYTRKCTSAYYIFNTISVLNDTIRIDDNVIKKFIADFAFHFVNVVNPIGNELTKEEIDEVYRLVDLAEEDKYIDTAKKNMLLKAIDNVIEYRKGVCNDY